MNKLKIEALVTQFFSTSKENYISEKYAISKDLVGVKMFDPPIMKIGNAEDPLFLKLKEPSGIGSHFLLPVEWLPQAKSVLTFFFPFSKKVCESNKKIEIWPSSEWLHSRIEGQKFINEFILYLQKEIRSNGYLSIVPSLDERFWAKTEINPSTCHPEASYTSNWSERHVAYICGLGTFGLSKGLITERGMAGRLASLITNLKVEPTIRKYNGIYDFCINCGACMKNCPAGAITKKGKDHTICSAFLNKTLDKYRPRYGCGKCQTGVPCEHGTPLFQIT